MSDVTKNELLINALLDDQLDATEAQRVRKQIANDKDLSAMLALFQEQRAAIADLPKFQLSDDFAHRIVDIGVAEAAAVPMVNRPMASASTVDWKKYAMSLAAIAALLMGMLVYQWTPGGQETAALIPAADATGADDFTDDDQPVASQDPMTQLILKTFPAVPSAGESDESMDAAPMPVAELADADSPVSNQSASEKRFRFYEQRALAKGNSGLIPIPEDAQTIDAESSQYGLGGDGDYAFMGTPVAAAPTSQSQPAIDQVWLMEVGESYSQDQLVTALTSNAISVPAELQTSTGDSDDEIPPGEVDGIQVAAKRSQMKRALSQLSQSDAVTISAFQLPNQANIDGVTNRFAKVDESNLLGATGGVAPATIAPANRAMAQKLRGNYFAPAPPSSKVPRTYMQLEKTMGVGDLAKSENASKPDAEEETFRSKSSVDRDETVTLNNAEEMKELFPGDDFDSDSNSEAFSNFVIIIRNEAKPKK